MRPKSAISSKSTRLHTMTPSQSRQNLYKDRIFLYYSQNVGVGLTSPRAKMEYSPKNLQLTQKVADFTKNLSLLTQVFFKEFIGFKKQIDEKAKSRDQLLDITKRLKTLIKETKDDTAVLKKQHQLYFSSAQKIEQISQIANAPVTKTYSYEINKLKENCLELENKNKLIKTESDLMKDELNSEQKLINELQTLIKKMKYEISEKSKECMRVKKELVSSENWITQLEQTCGKYEDGIERYYIAASHNSPK